METDKTMAFNMDCMVAMADMKDKEFDLAIVDPPYGLGKRLNSGGGKLKNIALVTMDTSWDAEIPPKEYFDELFRVSKQQIIWGGNYFGLPANRGFMVWDKQIFYETFSRCEYAWSSLDVPAGLFAFQSTQVGKSDIEKIHPTQKPIALYKWLLTKYAEAGWKILDTHLGSGSSRIAAYDLGFKFVGYELNEHYFNKQEERFKRHISQQNIFQE